MALNFDANVTDVVNCGSLPILDTIATGTRLIWAYPTTISVEQEICSKRTGGAGFNAFVCLANNRVRVDVDRPTDLVIVSSAWVTADTWQFFGAVWDASGTVDTDQHLYRGTLTTAAVEETTYAARTAGSGTIVSDAAGDFRIGNNDADTSHFRGSIAWVGQWNRALSLGEIRAQQFRPHVTSGCVLFQHLGFNGTTNVPDWSGNANVGAITGAIVADHVPLPPAFGLSSPTPYAVVSGAVTSTATLVLTRISLAAVGVMQPSGTGALALTAAAVAATGVEDFAGTSAMALTAVSLAASGQETAAGSVAMTLFQTILAGTGLHTTPVTSTAALQLTAMILSAAAIGGELPGGVVPAILSNLVRQLTSQLVQSPTRDS